MSAAEQTLVVHHLNDSRSIRVLWLLEELEIPYEIKKYQRSPEGLAPKELAAVHPLGTSPVITDGDVTLAESGAIIEYIIGKYGKGKAQPLDAGRVDNLFFTHYTEGTVMPLLVNMLIFRIITDRTPFFLRPLIRSIFTTVSTMMFVPRLNIQGQYIEKHLEKGGSWLAGGDEPTSADYMMGFALDFWAIQHAESLGPKTRAYITRIHERSAFKRVLEKGGKYALAQLPF